MKILAIESSCDETAAAVVEDGTKILGSTIASSTDMHKKYGGIVPEIAAREQLRCILPVIVEALTQAKIDYPHIDALAVTVGPGLIGSLLVGVETAKTIAMTTDKPIIPVNHVLAHMYANFINHQQINKNNKLTNTLSPITFPAISLVVSGGHTELYLMNSIKNLQWLGGTIDDAAGEAFDKTARLLGFENRGGVAIQESAIKYNQLRMTNDELRVKLPRPMIHDTSLNFSFSGLKTAVMREWKKLESSAQFTENRSQIVNEFAYEIQEAITDVLVEKTIRAAKQYNAESVLLSGGVASNIRLREKFITKLRNNELTKRTFSVPPINLCTDNAVYIASYAFFRGKPKDWHHIDAQPDLAVEVQ